jgi:hypothetical protein
VPIPMVAAAMLIWLALLIAAVVVASVVIDSWTDGDME